MSVSIPSHRIVPVFKSSREIRVVPFNEVPDSTKFALQQGMPTNDWNMLRDYLVEIDCHRTLIVEQQSASCYFIFFNADKNICDYFIVDYPTTQSIIASFGSPRANALFKEYHRRNPVLQVDVDQVDWRKDGF